MYSPSNDYDLHAAMDMLCIWFYAPIRVPQNNKLLDLKLLDLRSPSPAGLTFTQASLLLPVPRVPLPLPQFQAILSLSFTVSVASWLDPLASAFFNSIYTLSWLQSYLINTFKNSPVENFECSQSPSSTPRPAE